ncbi:MAG: hypothetical protein QM674_13365, partial [Burkholderiaceae bacterium]
MRTRIVVPPDANRLRYSFFDRIAEGISLSHKLQFVVLAHCLKDLPHLVHGLSRLGAIAQVVCIPYSLDPSSLKELVHRYAVTTPTLEELQSPEYLTSLVLQCVDRTTPLVIVEIGGYFADALPKIRSALGSQLKGVIEDTEAGHRRYIERLERLPCPVVSVARSPLKAAEDAAIGPSTVLSIEWSLRSADRSLPGAYALVLGYGKIGKGVATALRDKHCNVAVYDTDPIIRAQAIANGFRVPERKAALQSADLIVGASGCRSLVKEDFSLLKNGVVLASARQKSGFFSATQPRRAV